MVNKRDFIKILVLWDKNAPLPLINSKKPAWNRANVYKSIVITYSKEQKSLMGQDRGKPWKQIFW